MKSLLLLFSLLAVRAFAVDPPYRSVMTDTNGALATPANLFSANSNAIGAALFPGGSFSVPGKFTGSNFYGGAEGLTNRAYTSRKPRLTSPPIGIANWLIYYATPGNTVNTGPDEPGEQIFTNSVNNLYNSGIVTLFQSNVWIRLDYGWAGGTTNGVIIENSNKWPHGLKYSLDLAHSKGVKVQIDFSWELDVSMSQITRSAAKLVQLGFDGVGLLTDIGGSHYPTRPDMREFRELLNRMDEGRRIGNAKIQFGQFTNSNVALWTSANHNGTHIFFPPELDVADFVAVQEGFPNGAIKNTYTIVNHIRTNLLNLDFWVGPGHYAHFNGLDECQFGNCTSGGITNLFRQHLSCLAMADAGTWMTDSGFTAGNTRHAVWTNFYELYPYWFDPASHCGRVVYSNALDEIWVRKIGDGYGTNLVLLINAQTNGNHSITFTAGQLGIRSNEMFRVRDLWAHSDVTTFNSFCTRTVTETNAQLFLVTPVTPGTPTTNAPTAGQSLKYDSVTGLYYWN